MDENTTRGNRWSREFVAQIQSQVKQAVERGASERRAVLNQQVPRGTIQYWDERTAFIDACAAYKAFFESPEGVEFIHRLVVALHLVMALVVGGGIRPVILILELAQLTSFVAGSVGSHHQIARAIEQEVSRFGREQRQQLAGQMPPKSITVCEDETFHPEICLVAIEPVSNFILAEEYVEHRDSQTWSKTMQGSARRHGGDRRPIHQRRGQGYSWSRSAARRATRTRSIPRAA
jgi:hypothetical protein